MKNIRLVTTDLDKWIAGAMFIVALLAFSAGAASAQTLLPPIACPTNFSSCTANDVETEVSNAVPVGGDTCTDPGDTITVDLYVSWETNASSRYDLGFWISTDGDPVNGNNACVGSVAPIGAGTFPYVFRSLDDPPQTGDTCGDIHSNTDPVVWPVRATLPCVPSPGTNYLQVQACRAWEQNTGSVCQNLTDSGTGSKCDCSPLQVTQIPVPSAATLTVVKQVVPETYTDGRFNLYIDELNNGTLDHQIANAADGGALGPYIVPAGTNLNPGATHRVGETAGTSTDLANYTNSITCVKVGGGTVGPVAGTSTLVTVQPGDNWTCTITNTARPATITVVKIAQSLNGAPGCPSRVFGFNISPSTEFSLSANLCEGNPVAIHQVAPGAYTIAETDPDINAPTGWRLIDVECTGSGAADGDWTFTPGSVQVSGDLGAAENLTCTFTNQFADPLAVDLASLTAEAQGSSVVLAWETVSEQESAGFNLYRGRSEQGPWERVNPRLIPTQVPGATSGAQYTWVDTPRVSGSIWYVLEDMALSGASTRYDPLQVVLEAPNAVRAIELNATRAGVWWATGLGALIVLAALAFTLTKGFRKR